MKKVVGKHSNSEDLFRDINAFERELGLPENWLINLRLEDDWSFVIKLHALLEAAVTHVVASELKDERVRAFAEKLSLRGQFGKLMLAKILALVEPRHMAAIEAIARLRNDCVHDVRNVDFTFAKWCRRTEVGERAEFLKRVVFYEGSAKDFLRSAKEYASDTYKGMLLVSAVRLLAELYDRRGLSRRLSRENPRLKAIRAGLPKIGKKGLLHTNVAIENDEPS